jgi:hypothetical protein
MLIKSIGENMTKDLTKVKVYEGNEPTLEEAQKIVGGYVELVDLEGYGCLLVDEDGKLKRKHLNSEATKLYNKLFDGFIVGNVIHILPDARREW